jgi:putative transposase
MTALPLPESNGSAGRFSRTLKENLLWMRTFDTVEELRQALLEFGDAYRPPAAIRVEQFSPAVLAP